MKRRQPISSASGAVAAMAAAVRPIAPPACVSLRDGDGPFWDAVVRARAASLKV
jgi:ABC-type sugar transport system substrate-binding protein